MISGRSELRVTFAAPMMSARSVQALLQEIESRAQFPSHVAVHAAGYASLYTRIVERLVTSQIVGFSVALGLILLSIAIATRSRIRTLLAVPANLVPVAATLGLMGWTGIPLDIATATIATVILGLIVDDTVHILRPAGQPGTDITTTINDSVSRSGSSLLMTSLVLCGGFLIMGIAEIRSIAWFGLLTSFAMATAVITDLTLLPALARMAHEFESQGGAERHPTLPIS
jgi:predicted RND superfamily exporter protein